MPMTYRQRLLDHVRKHLEEAASLLATDARQHSICGLIDEAIELALETAYETELRPKLRVIQGGKGVAASNGRPD